MTHQQIFLKWCREHDVRPRRKKHTKTIYVLPPRVIQITYFGLKIDPPEITVYFDESGKWLGGTNWLWDHRLPWIKAKYQNHD